jgi:hypothetical protein
VVEAWTDLCEETEVVGVEATTVKMEKKAIVSSRCTTITRKELSVATTTE